MTTPEVTYFQRATRSLRARATIVVRSHLPAIVEATIQALGPEHSGKFVADPFELDQRSRHTRHCVRRDDGMPQLAFDRSCLLDCHLQTVEFTINLSLQMRRQRPSVAGLQSDQALAAVPTQWLITRDAGLAPTPWQSGSIDREQGVSKAGNPRLRTMLLPIGLAVATPPTRLGSEPVVPGSG